MVEKLQSILVSNQATWELSYEESLPSKESRLNTVVCLVGVTAAWSMFLFAGTLMLTFYSFHYLKLRWNQSKIINVLKKQKHLEEYSRNRIKRIDKHIYNLKSHAISLMEKDLKKPNELELPIPQKKARLKDHLSSQLPKRYWKSFPWDDFLKTNFFQKSKTLETPDKKTLLHLEETRVKFNFLVHQKEILSKLTGNDRVEAISKIAEISFVKNAFKRQESKEWITRSILWMLPSGIFWDLYVNSPLNNRSTYEGKKHFLPSTTDLKKYIDLVDAHNQLIKSHDFLVPYIKHTII